MIACVWNATRDQGDNMVPPLRVFERADFFFDPARLSAGWRANYDQITRLLQGLFEILSQLRRSRQFFTVAKDRHDPRRNFTFTAGPADQLVRDPICLQLVMKPIRYRGVLVAVADERPILHALGILLMLLLLIEPNESPGLGGTQVLFWIWHDSNGRPGLKENGPQLDRLDFENAGFAPGIAS